MSKKVGDTEILFQWKHLDWLFDDDEEKVRKKRKEFCNIYGDKYWENAIPAGFKIDHDKNYYVSVPRWKPGIPATVNKIIFKDGKPMLSAYPNGEMNEVNNPHALQSVLGFEIDEKNRAWFLDQGFIQEKDRKEKTIIHGAQKIICWDITTNKLVESIKILDEVKASFLNDLVVDNKNGFIYITDSGIPSGPSKKIEGGLIVYNMRTKELKRFLHQHESTQPAPGFRFEIAGKEVSNNEGVPMQTGADGIALSADRETLYWCPLTSRNLYAIDTELLQDFSTDPAKIEKSVKNLGDKRTNSDGLEADNKGNIYYTMLEDNGIGIYNQEEKTCKPFVTNKKMLWVDGMTFDNEGYLVFISNRLHEWYRGKTKIDWKNGDNYIVWNTYVGAGVKSYLYYE